MLEQRGTHDLEHEVIQCLKIGRLQTIARIPVIAGDSMTVHSQGLMRLNNLRRPLAFDLKLDMWAFFRPYRFTYDNWAEMIENQHFAGADITTLTYTGDGELDYLLTKQTTVPKHIPNDYLSIWNHYFRDPSAPEYADDSMFPTNPEVAAHGLRIGQLPAWPTRMMHGTDKSQLASAQISVTAGKMNPRDFDAARLSIRMEQAQQYMGQRYEDVHKLMFGSTPPLDSLKRPTYLGNSHRWLSSHDISGTSGTHHGERVGSVVGGASFRMPRRFFSEHGTLWVLAALRPRPLYLNEQHYLDVATNFDDATKMPVFPPTNEFPPTELAFSDIFSDGGDAAAGFIAWHDWYRSQPSYASSLLATEDRGWQPRFTPGTSSELWRVPNYDDIFQTLQGGHGKLFVRNSVTAHRPVPSRTRSIL